MGQKDMSVRSGNEIEGREQTHDLFIRPAVDKPCWPIYLELPKKI
jgi:hypothetical protein